MVSVEPSAPKILFSTHLRQLIHQAGQTYLPIYTFTVPYFLAHPYCAVRPLEKANLLKPACGGAFKMAVPSWHSTGTLDIRSLLMMNF